ncbi:hypothetical protein ACJ41O_015100 [Fusarium nematophilum]
MESRKSCGSASIRSSSSTKRQGFIATYTTCPPAQLQDERFSDPYDILAPLSSDAGPDLGLPFVLYPPFSSHSRDSDGDTFFDSRRSSIDHTFSIYEGRASGVTYRSSEVWDVDSQRTSSQDVAQDCSSSCFSYDCYPTEEAGSFLSTPDMLSPEEASFHLQQSSDAVPSTTHNHGDLLQEILRRTPTAEEHDALDRLLGPTRPASHTQDDVSVRPGGEPSVEAEYSPCLSRGHSDACRCTYNKKLPEPPEEYDDDDDDEDDGPLINALDEYHEMLCRDMAGLTEESYTPSFHRHRALESIDGRGSRSIKQAKIR